MEKAPVLIGLGLRQDEALLNNYLDIYIGFWYSNYVNKRMCKMDLAILEGFLNYLKRNNISVKSDKARDDLKALIQLEYRLDPDEALVVADEKIYHLKQILNNGGN